MYGSFYRAASLKEAVFLLAEKTVSTKILSGGTDLMVRMKKGEICPDRLLSITRIPELAAVRRENGKIVFGSALTFSAIQSSILMNEEAPFMIEAASQVGSPQIRAVGTIGGNVVNAAPHADTVPVLVALDGKAKVVSTRGEKLIPVSELVLGPHRTALLADEILTEFSFEVLQPGTGTAFLKLGRRSVMVRARISAACAVCLDDKDIVTDVRIAAGAVTPKCERFRPAEEILLGRRMTEKGIKEASGEVSREMVNRGGVRWSTEYKAPVVSVLVERALRIASSRAHKEFMR
ncbi:MAG: xanthine dehydrogenase family protein subunit M [Candidatus Eisenbacteria bacterium]|nr:xanthine dehydrogenase family protein subunit M [Candidatus Eisenbacteria bacterium]